MALSVITLAPFREWFDELRDKRAKSIIISRLTRISEGNFGNTRSLGAKLSEIKIDFGPGYRLYFLREGLQIVVILCGGDKSSQGRDIDRAMAIAARWQEYQDEP